MVINSDPLSKPSSPPLTSGNGKVKGKTSFKRLSDVLQTGSGIGGKRDLWLVVFNDVVLRCQRTGTTSLPIGGASNGRANSLPDLQGKAKYATTGRRNSHTKPRNMYKFLKASNLFFIYNSCIPETAFIRLRHGISAASYNHGKAWSRWMSTTLLLLTHPILT